MPQDVATQRGAVGNEVKVFWVLKFLWKGRVCFHILHKKVQVLKSFYSQSLREWVTNREIRKKIHPKCEA